jgi:hypothetical protein
MRNRLAISLLTLAVLVVLLLILAHQDKIASSGNAAMGYLSFNRGETKEAQKIMNFWREDGVRVAAVKRIATLDYLVIVIYTLYLCLSLNYRRKVEQGTVPGPARQRRWLLYWLGAGIYFILVAALIDGFQDALIYSYVSSVKPVSGLGLYTTIKWTFLFLGVAPLLISLITRQEVTYLSGLLKTVWTFFPSVVFVFLTIFCFWVQGQGKDIMIAFTERTGSFNHNLIFFFLAIGFWVYVTWYSSRVIAYVKDTKSRIAGNFLDNYPRLAGNACFLVLELAVLQSPLLENRISSGLAWIIFILALIGLHFVDKWIRNNLEIDSNTMSNRFWIVFALFFALLLITACFPFSRKWYTLFFLLLVFQVVYLFYINLHHFAIRGVLRASGPPRFFARIMNYFFVPTGEAGFFKWFLCISLVAIIIDILAIWNLGFARDMGPFPLLIFAFAVLLLFLNMVTAFSVRYSVNFHLVLFLVAFFLGLRETHKVRIKDLGQAVNGYAHRPSLDRYLRSWLKRLPPDSSRYDMYFVLANGGASRSGYWTASVLGKLQDASMKHTGRFSDHVFCLSGTSGGGVGVATFFALLDDKRTRTSLNTLYRISAEQFLQQDYFSYTVARMLGPDYFNYIFHFPVKDRGAALEASFEEYDTTANPSLYNPSFNQPFSHFKAINPDDGTMLPILFVNTTRMQDGNPGLVTNLKLDSNFNARIDVLGLLDSTTDISMASGAILGARFPYLSPAGRIGTNYFVDGGYFDNSGAGAVQELIRGIINIGRDDTVVGNQIHRLHFKVLHILNSPIIQDSGDQKPVAPIKNDLFAPIATIVGAYGMQTTVNDGRLINYIADINKYYGILANYTQVSLYKDSAEWSRDPNCRRFKQEPAYSMNWFMSDSTRNRIKDRLDSHPQVDSLIQRIRF